MNQINGGDPGLPQKDSLEMIEAGKKVAEAAAFYGIFCPVFRTGLGCRTASKIVYIVQQGPKLTPSQIEQFSRDLKLLHQILEGERAEMYDKVIRQAEKMTNMVRERKNYRDTDGDPVFSDSDIETVKQVEATILEAKRIDPIQVK